MGKKLIFIRGDVFAFFLSNIATYSPESVLLFSKSVNKRPSKEEDANESIWYFVINAHSNGKWLQPSPVVVLLPPIFLLYYGLGNQIILDCVHVGEDDIIVIHFLIPLSKGKWLKPTPVVVLPPPSLTKQKSLQNNRLPGLTYKANVLKVIHKQCRNFPQKSLTLSVRPSKKFICPRRDEVWWSSNFVKVLEVEFPSKKSDTFSETIQKIF